jgi:hypothetical protein
MTRAQTLVLILAAMLAFLTFAWWQQDDFYIHLQYAKHVLHDGEWSFNRGIPAYGSTSPLWVIIVALVGLSGLDLPLVAKVLSIGFAILTVVYLGMNLSCFRYRSIGVLCLVSLMANHWVRLAAGSGMEATLAGFLALVLGVQVLKKPIPSHGQAVNRGLLTGLLVLARPEWFILPLFFVLAGRSTWRVAPGYFAGLLIVVSPWLGFAWYTFGTCVPNTVAIKSFMITPSVPMLESAMTSAIRLLSFYLPTNGVEVVGILILMGGVLSGWFRAAVPRGSNSIAKYNVPLMAWALTLVIPAVYFVNQARGGESISYRYGAPALPMLIVLGWLGVEAVYEHVKRPSIRRTLLVGVTAVVCVSNVTLSLAHLPFLRRSVEYMEMVLAGYGKWVKINSDPACIVACYDVGAIAYYSDRRVLDLVGLNSMEAIQHQEVKVHDLVNEYAVRKFKPDYLLTRLQVRLSDYAGVLPRYEVLLSSRVPSYRFEPSKLFSEPEYATVYLMRLYWPESRTP